VVPGALHPASIPRLTNVTSIELILRMASSPLVFIRYTAAGHIRKRGPVHFTSIVSAIAPLRKGKIRGRENPCEATA